MKYIYGLNKSGQSIINFLDKLNEDYYCWDDNKYIRNQLILSKKKIKLVKPKDLNFKTITESFISPGISLNNKQIILLKKKKIKIFRDLELYSRYVANKYIIAITGTNGKSTTSKLISDVLKKNKIKNFLGGNIGTPLLDFNKKHDKSKHHVIELSSFQLESFTSFSPFISILLTITPDHLDRYNNYQDYIYQKEKIIKCNNKKYNIISIDGKKNFEIFIKYKKNNIIIPISKKILKKGIYYKNEKIIDNFFDNGKEIKLDCLSPSLYESFNIENILAVYAVSRILKINIKNFIKILKNFKGLPHRMEKIYKNNFFQIINNSKATNLDAFIKSISDYKNINVIMGGRSKEKSYKSILKYKNKINKIYLIGESSNIIFNQLKNEIKCFFGY